MIIPFGLAGLAMCGFCSIETESCAFPPPAAVPTPRSVESKPACFALSWWGSSPLLDNGILNLWKAFSQPAGRFQLLGDGRAGRARSPRRLPHVQQSECRPGDPRASRALDEPAPFPTSVAACFYRSLAHAPARCRSSPRAVGRGGRFVQGRDVCPCRPKKRA